MGSPEHLNGHQRDTLAQIFRHPTSHNIEWHSIVSLLNAVGDVQETKQGHLVVTVDGETETLSRATRTSTRNSWPICAGPEEGGVRARGGAGVGQLVPMPGRIVT